MCYYYPDAAKLGGAIMAGGGSTSAPNAFGGRSFYYRYGPQGLILYLGKRSI